MNGSYSRWLARLRQRLAVVVIIAHREWRTTVFTKVFALFGLGYPLVLSTLLWLGVLGLLLVKLFGGFGEIPETTKLIEELLGANQKIVPTKYYVVDNSESKFGDSVRSEILRRDISLVVDFLRGKSMEDYAHELPSMNPYATAEVEEKLVSLRDKFQDREDETNGNSSLVSELVHAISYLQQLVDSAGVNIDDRAIRRLWYSSDKFDRDIQYIAMWWVENVELLTPSIPNISMRYFTELTEKNFSIKELNELLATNDIEGYFVLPKDFSDIGASLDFVTGELSEGHSRRIPFLLKNWYEEIAEYVLAHPNKEFTDPVRGDPSVPIRARTIHVINGAEQGSVEYDSSVFTQQPRFLNLWIRSFWVSTFFITLSYSIYAMSFNTTEEKQNRIAEVLLSNVSGFNLLDGKVWGNTLVILTVCGFWFVSLGLPIVWMIGLAPDMGSIALRELFNPLYILNWFLFLLLAVTMFGYILTAVGSLFATERVLPLVYWVLAVCFGIGILATMDPNTSFATVVRFIPPISLFAMVSLTTSLPSLPIYFTLLAIAIGFIWIVRAVSGQVFFKGVLVEVVPGKFSKLLRVLRTTA